MQVDIRQSSLSQTLPCLTTSVSTIFTIYHQFLHSHIVVLTTSHSNQTTQPIDSSCRSARDGYQTMNNIQANINCQWVNTLSSNVISTQSQKLVPHPQNHRQPSMCTIFPLLEYQGSEMWRLYSRNILLIVK